MPNGSPRVLVVDDDVKLVGLLERSLRFEGFDVACAYTAEAALAVLREREPDLVLLDIGMPERDGIGVLRETRQVSDVAVVMLTARDEVRDEVGALDLGADDYVAKPFDIDELVARMRAVLRRRGKPALDRLSYGDVRLDLGRREADRDWRPLAAAAGGGLRGHHDRGAAVPNGWRHQLRSTLVCLHADQHERRETGHRQRLRADG